MDRLRLCECSECGSQFALSSELIENMKEVTCPICESRFDAPEEEPADHDDNLDDDMIEDNENDDENEDDEDKDDDDDEEKEKVLKLSKNNPRRW